ncbi:hypothetical protein SRHO_G00271000 [Serrasalmus rhombeus]
MSRQLREKASSKPIFSTSAAVQASRRAEVVTSARSASSSMSESTSLWPSSSDDPGTTNRSNTAENGPSKAPPSKKTLTFDNDTPPRWFAAFGVEFDHKMGKTILNESLQPIHERLDSLEWIFESFRNNIAELESTTAAHDTQLEQLERECCSLKQANTSLAEKLDELENRSRRCNLRIIGIPEGLESNDPVGFTTELLKELFGPGLFQSQPIIERAHRLGRSPAAGGAASGRPRAMIAFFHSFQDKERALRKSRDELYKGHKLRFFPDYISGIAVSEDGKVTWHLSCFFFIPRKCERSVHLKLRTTW